MPQDIIHPPISKLHDWLTQGQRVMLLGASGSGKSSLIHAALAALPHVPCLTADPGRPTMGCPGALALGHLEDGVWRPSRLAPVATLDPVRHRLPILTATASLARSAPGALVLDTPGVLRGGGAGELHRALAEVAGIDHVLLLDADPAQLTICADWFAGLPLTLSRHDPHPAARALTDGQRHEARRSAWMAAQQGAAREVWSRGALTFIAAPPEDLVDHIFAAYGAAGELLGMGYVVAAAGDELVVSLRRTAPGQPRAILLRDAAWRNERLMTVNPAPAAPVVPTLPARTTAFMLRERAEIPFGLGGPIKSGGALRLMLPGGVFDDPMAVVRFEHQPRAFFFDLGSIERVPSKIIHQTDDVFMSHAHLDHIGGFVHLLRKSMGRTTPYRIYGPPEMADRFAHLLHGFTWDRVEEGGPAFEVGELHGERLIWRRVDVQHTTPTWLREQAAPNGLLIDEPRLSVRAVALDHVTTSLAFAVEEPCAFDVRGNILRERGWRAGDWLGQLKQRVAARELDAMIQVTTQDGGVVELAASELGELVLMARAGQKIVYATDFGDTPENRAALLGLARGAHAMVCESSFVEADRDQATRTRHLTTTACAQMAAEADVGLLIPFHPSVRNEEAPEQVWREIRAIFPRTHAPPAIEAILSAHARI
jgi:ribonuclease Z